MDWYPTLPFGEGPRYLQIVGSLEHDIATGKVAPGQRLPTHRDMAASLGLSVGTVSKAYSAAERRGLISGEVGRGTFVLRPPPELGVGEGSNGQMRRINLALNAPPTTGEGAALASVMTEVLASDRYPGLLGYLPHQGRADHRATMARFLSSQAMSVGPENLLVTHGAQHGISIAMRLLAKPGATVLAENLPYSGMLSLGLMEGYNLRGVTMDRHGLVPERLEQAITETGARVLYTTPTLQTATGALMPEARRREIVEILREHRVYIVEDDAYGFLCEEPLAPLSAYLPEQSFYVVSFAKCLSPGLRIGAMICPEEFQDRAINAIRSTGWMANAIMAEAVCRMIDNGLLEEQILAKRRAAAERTELAKRRLGHLLDLQSDVPAFHVWLKLHAGRSMAELMSRLAHLGITVVAPTLLEPFDDMSNGLRLCLGAPESLDDLDYALQTFRSVFEESRGMSLV